MADEFVRKAPSSGWTIVLALMDDRRQEFEARWGPVLHVCSGGTGEISYEVMPAQGAVRLFGDNQTEITQRAGTIKRPGCLKIVSRGITALLHLGDATPQEIS